MFKQMFLLLLLGFLWFPVIHAETQLEVFKTISYGPLAELSGLVKSKRFPGVIWAHNDSGDIPRLFAINETGEVLFPSFLQNKYYTDPPQAGKEEWPGHLVHLAANLDWEDIAIDEDFIYIADLGNNGNARRDMGIYVIPEPNPTAVEATRPLRFLPIRYPDQAQFPAEEWHFDNEALFTDGGHLYFLTKHRQPGKPAQWESGSKLYRLETNHTDKFNILKKVDQHPGVLLATGADLSPDGEHLVVLGYTQLWVFSKPGLSARKKGRWLSGDARRLELTLANTRQAEAVCWLDNDTLLIGNENRDLFKVELSDIPPLDD